MPTFYAKPTPIEALQFDPTIRPWPLGVWDRLQVDVVGVPLTHYYIETGEYGSSVEIIDTDWIIYHPGGIIRKLNDRSFRESYVPAEVFEVDKEAIDALPEEVPSQPDEGVIALQEGKEDASGE